MHGVAALEVSSAKYSTLMTDVLLRALPLDIVVAYHRQITRSSHRSSLTDRGSFVSGAASIGGAAASAAPCDGKLETLLTHLMIEVECRGRSVIDIFPSDIVDAYHRQRALSSHSSSLTNGESSVGGAAASIASFDDEIKAPLTHLIIEAEFKERSGIDSKKEQARPKAQDGREDSGMPPTSAVLNSSASGDSKCLFCD